MSKKYLYKEVFQGLYFHRY